MFQFRARSFVALLALAGAGLISAPGWAQTTSQDAGFTPESQTPQTQQQRAQILKEAQARVMARRRIREQQVVQETYSHRYEVYGGGAYLRFHPGPNLQHNTEAAWNAGITDWIRPKLGVTADVRGYYGTAITDNFDYQVFKPAVSEYTFMAGPQYRFYQSLHWDWNAQVLAGIGHGNFSTGTGGFPASDVGLYSDGNRLAVSVGAAVDYNLSPTLALRLMPNYLLTDFGSPVEENLGFTAGVVFRFGRQ